MNTKGLSKHITYVIRDVMEKKYTCVNCEVKFTKIVPNERTEVVCPICGTKQKFRYKVMGSGGSGERWEEPSPWDDPEWW